MLPPANRERIVVTPGKYDFYLANDEAPLRPRIDMRKVYNNTILTVEKLLLTAEDATAAYRATHQATDLYRAHYPRGLQPLSSGRHVGVRGGVVCRGGGACVSPPLSGAGGGLALAPGAVRVQHP